MREGRLLRSGVVALLLALAAGGCMRRAEPTYVMIDPATGRQTQVMLAAPPQAVYAQPQGGFDLYGRGGTPQAYAAPQAQAQTQTQDEFADLGPSRGLFGKRRATTYAQAQPQQPYVVQYSAPPQAYVVQQPQQPYVQGYASAPAGYAPSYTLDSGDRLRITVFGQDGISNSYTVDAGGNVNLPLIGTVAARGTTTQQLSQLITTRLKQGYVREPHVTVEVETYRPFFILGEVNNPGQYAYVANMTAEAAVAIAGGFSPRANKRKVELTRNGGGQSMHGEVPLNYPLRPGDTIVVKERWF